MKNTGRTALLLILVLALGTSVAHAQAKNLNKVEELLVAMGMEESVNTATTQILYDLFVTTPEFDMHQDILLKYTEERVSWDVIKEDIVRIYAEQFSDKEVVELTRFYHTDLGQKLVKVSPDMSSQIQQAVKKRFDSDLDMLELQMKTRELDMLMEEETFFKGEDK